jgi:hypothetical protein
VTATTAPVSDPIFGPLPIGTGGFYNPSSTAGVIARGVIERIEHARENDLRARGRGAALGGAGGLHRPC